MGLCNVALKENRIGRIEEFTRCLETALADLQIPALQKYTADLRLAVDSFDVAGMRRQLRAYADLVMEYKKATTV